MIVCVCEGMYVCMYVCECMANEHVLLGLEKLPGQDGE